MLFFLFSTIFCNLILDFCVKTRTRFSLRDKRLFKIIEVEIMRNDYIFIFSQDIEKPGGEEVFHVLTPEEDRTFLTREEITSISKARLEYVCEIFNRRHKRVRDEL